MSNVKFSQLPDQGLPTDATIVPTVAGGVNYTVTGANLKAFVNNTTGNVTAGNVNVTGAVSATGNVTGAYVIGDGSLLTGIVSSYGNSNVAAYLPVNSANIQANFISAIGNISGSYILGNGSQLTGLPATYTDANVTTLLSSFGSNTVSTTGNITGGNLFGNISGTTGGYGNANVQSVLQTYTGTLTAGTVSATGNITGNYILGNGSALTGIAASLNGTMTGNIAGAGYSITGLGQLSATGNITGANVVGTHFGSGSNLTGIPTSILAGTGISVSAATGAITITNNNPTPFTTANVAAYLPTYTGNITAGNVAATGVISAATLSGTHTGNGAGLSNIVTSITAGAGISINSSTGAVTITNTGSGGTGTAIASGTSNVSILTANGNIEAWAGGIRQVRVLNLNGSGTGFTPVVISGLQVENRCIVGANLEVNGANTSIAGTLNVTGSVNLNSAAGLNLFSASFNRTPETKANNSTGTAGDMSWDANYIYVCTATNTWKRVALSTF